MQLTFGRDLVTRPVIHELGQRFAVVTNIRRASVTREEGWAVMEIEGELEDIDRGLAWVEACGVRVDPVEGELAT